MMTCKDENSEKLNSIAMEVLSISKNMLLVHLRYMDMALSQFSFIPYDKTMSTEGKHIFYNPVYILKRFQSGREVCVRDYLHLVLHCVFRHMFMNPTVNRKYWDLACDIAVEYCISRLNLACCTAERDMRQQNIFQNLETKLKYVTAEKIYAYFKEINLSDKDYTLFQKLFYADDHDIWYTTDDSIDTMIHNNRKNTESSKNPKPDGNNEDINNPDEMETEKNADESGSDKDKPSADQQDRRGKNSRTSDENTRASISDRTTLSQTWKDIAEKMQTDFETFSKGQGDEAGGLTQNLKAVNREKYDYTGFLKKFATICEVMKINDDEFDYIFYTYGLKLYEKMPLIEPLEYKEVKRIREFVIAIDTSCSTSGETVQMFLNKTYNILKSTESFFSKVNVHIIQCDAQIQEDAKITTQEEFDGYLATMQIKGLGGTDFRPVFTYVDKLIKQREFHNLKGLIYFTDGYGVFPSKKPPFQSAFVFIDDEYGNPDVPPWAIKLVLQKDEI